ncbi:uncharacterized protein SCODWIG_02503 [Saccharomycodes ludwigii]|uniref:Major facilitator superfamily (MFS) profile domain-containing protein n=1 Tax=Saccharomycodes ludwigii TaxID=36035 RepID=A0A376B7V9_9ASCO|nr:hypothetical protein SCDLUD_002412 [Saccharomycodes ludwigii]KAH3900950.1 hypothetical protein SCDLUD_002412 [Saccharomycodes ludwigii]SSD60742.1 uncharacterized protein SCODWIG_02503 [Saccharomycodes ludwigii]
MSQNLNKPAAPLLNEHQRYYTNEELDYETEQDAEDILDYTNGSEENSEDDTQERWINETLANALTLKWHRRPSKYKLYFLIATQSISSSLLIGPTTILLLSKICKSVSTTTEGCKTNFEAQKILSEVQSYQYIINGILGFTLSGKFGELSDRYGRTFVFKVFSVVNTVHIFLLIFFFQPGNDFSKWESIICLCSGSMAGGIMSLIANGNSYLSDIIPAQKRTVAISLLMSIVYGGLGLGPFLGSILVKYYPCTTNSNNDGNLAPFYFSFILRVFSLILCFFYMGETRHQEAMLLSQQEYLIAHKNIDANRIKYFKTKFLSMFTGVLKIWQVNGSETDIIIPHTNNRNDKSRARINVLILLVIDLLHMGITVGCTPVLIQYSILKYGFDGVQIGYTISIHGLGKAIVLLLLTPIFMGFLQKRTNKMFYVPKQSIDSNEKICIITSLAFMVSSIISIFVVHNEFAIYLSAVLQSLSAMISPTIQSVIIKYFHTQYTGQIFGAIALLRHLDMLIMPSFFLQVYSHTVDDNPITVFYIPLFLGILAILLTPFLTPTDRNDDVNMGNNKHGSITNSYVATCEQSTFNLLTETNTSHKDSCIVRSNNSNRASGMVYNSL